MSIRRVNPGKRFCGAVVHGNTVYLAGQTAPDPSAGVRSQTEQVLQRITELLATAGTNKSKLLTATVYLSDIRHYDEMNAAWDAWVDKNNMPARATVEAKLASPKLLVEIASTAALDM